MSRVSLITVAYRKPDLLRNYVSGIRKYEDLSDIEMILVDVAPEQESEIVCDSYISLDHANYSQAVNAGLKAANGDYIIWGNEDLRLSGPFIDKLLKPVRENPRTIAGPRRRVDYGWPFIIGWLLGMHKVALEEIGYLDEQFPGTFEDTDYGARAFKVGYEIEQVELPVQHISLGRLNKYLIPCRDIFLEKHGRGPM